MMCLRCVGIQTDNPNAQKSERNWLNSELQARDSEEVPIRGNSVPRPDHHQMTE